MAKKKYTINEIAAALVEQNESLKTVVQENPGESYKLVEQSIKPMMREIGALAGTFVRTQQIVWAIINECEGTAAVPRLQLKLR